MKIYGDYKGLFISIYKEYFLVFILTNHSFCWQNLAQTTDIFKRTNWKFENINVRVRQVNRVTASF